MLFSHISNLNNEETQLVFYHILIYDLNFLEHHPQIEELYLEKLVVSKKSEELAKYIAVKQ
jgi:hypothetical protein